MAKSNNAFIKKQKEQIRKKKRQEKEEKKSERKKNSKGGDLENMIAYVDEYGNFTTEPPKNFPLGSVSKSNNK
jgi:S-adenosylmethionine hydrolase